MRRVRIENAHLKPFLKSRRTFSLDGICKPDSLYNEKGPMMLQKNKLPDVGLKSNYEAKVLSVDWGRKDEHGKTLRLRFKGQRGVNVSFRVPRSACVTEGDIIQS